MLRLMKAGPVVAVAVALAACASTSFDTTWTAPDAGRLTLGPGTKVLAMVVDDNAATKRGFESALVSELSGHGLDAVPAHVVVPEEAARDKDEALAYVQKSGARYALIMRVTGADQEVGATRGMTAGMWNAPAAFSSPVWGGQGWGGESIRTDTIVGVQTLLYDLEADKLVWSGQSETTNPSKAESLMRELVRLVGDELQKEGLIGPPTQ